MTVKLRPRSRSRSPTTCCGDPRPPSIIRCAAWKYCADAGNRVLLGIGLTNHADYCLALGRLDEAAECSREALGIWTPLEKYGRGYATENLGRVYLESDRLSEAIASLNEAYRLHLADGALRAQAAALKYLAEAQRRAGYPDQARESLTEAVVLFKKLNAVAEVAAAQSALAALA